jgi:hypothetical protein
MWICEIPDLKKDLELSLSSSVSSRLNRAYPVGAHIFAGQQRSGAKKTVADEIGENVAVYSHI